MGLEALLTNKDAIAFSRSVATTLFLVPESPETYWENLRHQGIRGSGFVYVSEADLDSKIEDPKSKRPNTVFSTRDGKKEFTCVPYDQFFKITKTENMKDLYNKYYAANPYYGEGDKKTQPPPVNRLWNIYGVNLETEKFYLYHVSSNGKWRLDTKSKLNFPHHVVKDGMVFETSKTPQIFLSDLKKKHATRSGDGTIPYESLTFPQRNGWSDSIPMFEHKELNKCEHRDTISTGVFFKLLVSYVCQKSDSGTNSGSGRVESPRNRPPITVKKSTRDKLHRTEKKEALQQLIKPFIPTTDLPGLISAFFPADGGFAKKTLPFKPTDHLESVLEPLCKKNGVSLDTHWILDVHANHLSPHIAIQSLTKQIVFLIEMTRKDLSKEKAFISSLINPWIPENELPPNQFFVFVPEGLKFEPIKIPLVAGQELVTAVASLNDEAENQIKVEEFVFVDKSGSKIPATTFLMLIPDRFVFVIKKLDLHNIQIQETKNPVKVFFDPKLRYYVGTPMDEWEKVCTHLKVKGYTQEDIQETPHFVIEYLTTGKLASKKDKILRLATQLQMRVNRETGYPEASPEGLWKKTVEQGQKEGFTEQQLLFDPLLAKNVLERAKANPELSVSRMLRSSPLPMKFSRSDNLTASSSPLSASHSSPAFLTSGNTSGPNSPLSSPSSNTLPAVLNRRRGVTNDDTTLKPHYSASSKNRHSEETDDCSYLSTDSESDLSPYASPRVQLGVHSRSPRASPRSDNSPHSDSSTTQGLGH
eukprot:TRINITY_DN4751_c0_g2_i1.p1 TRINITY_DN4751_c0_g2~~TRINITY_DN4751_c0_g2_i1.p1  ORF type:complete len:758 (+),score=144.55 TRINITY_DN4751_c0_g2_i1:77-2350(+)